MKIEVEIDPTKLNLMPQNNLAEAFKSLHDLYGIIWCEACYDPDNEETQKICQRMLPLIQKANEILKFKS